MILVDSEKRSFNSLPLLYQRDELEQIVSGVVNVVIDSAKHCKTFERIKQVSEDRSFYLRGVSRLFLAFAEEEKWILDRMIKSPFLSERTCRKDCNLIDILRESGQSDEVCEIYKDVVREFTERFSEERSGQMVSLIRSTIQKSLEIVAYGKRPQEIRLRKKHAKKLSAYGIAVGIANKRAIHRPE